MHGWQSLALQILMGVLANAIIGILGWLGKRQFMFFKRTLSFSPSSKKFAHPHFRSRMIFQEWKLFNKIFNKSPLYNHRSLTASSRKTSYPPSFNQKRVTQKKLFPQLGLNNQVNLVKPI